MSKWTSYRVVAPIIIHGCKNWFQLGMINTQWMSENQPVWNVGQLAAEMKGVVDEKSPSCLCGVRSEAVNQTIHLSVITKFTSVAFQKKFKLCISFHWIYY